MFSFFLVSNLDKFHSYIQNLQDPQLKIAPKKEWYGMSGINGIDPSYFAQAKLAVFVQSLKKLLAETYKNHPVTIYNLQADTILGKELVTVAMLTQERKVITRHYYFPREFFPSVDSVQRAMFEAYKLPVPPALRAAPALAAPAPLGAAAVPAPAPAPAPAYRAAPAKS